MYVTMRQEQTSNFDSYRNHRFKILLAIAEKKDALRRDARASPRLMRQLYAASWLRVRDARAISRTVLCRARN